MKKLLRTLSVSSLAITSLSPLMVVTSCNEPFIVDEEIKAHDAEGWKHAIEYIGSCGHPTLFLGEDASYYIQECVNLYLSSAQYAKQKGFVYTNPGYEYNDQILLIYGQCWNYKENKAGEKAGYFEYNYGTVVNEIYGYSDILKNSKLSSPSINLSLGNQMLITNYQDFDLSLDKYDKSRSDYLPYINPYSKTISADAFILVINKILDLYEQIDPNIKFNFVVPEPPIDQFFDWKDITRKIVGDTSKFVKTIFRMIRHMDKFYICTDGAYTWNTNGSNKRYYDYFCRNGYMSSAEQAGILNLLQTLPFEEAVNYYKFINPWCFYNNEKYMVHFAPNINTCYAPRVLNPKKHLTKETTCKYASPWFITAKYKDVLTDVTYYSKFEKSILDFYNSLSESGELKKFENFITKETRQNFDSSKKNLIFILSGSFRTSKNPPEILWQECKKITDQIRKNYPTTEWNYIYKLHPGTVPEDCEKILKKLLGDPIPNNCVILEKIYPFEYLVSLDQTLVKEGIETNYHLIDPRTFDDKKPSGILTGYDIHSTCLYSSMSMFVNEYGYSWDQVKKLIQYDAYYFARKYDCSSYQAIEGKDYSYQNYAYTKNFYQLLNDVGEFVDIDKFKFID